MDDFMSVNDIAGMLKLNPQTVRNWIDRGELSAHRVGRRVRIRRENFDALVTANYSGPKRPAREPTGTIWDGIMPAPVMPND